MRYFAAFSLLAHAQSHENRQSRFDVFCPQPANRAANLYVRVSHHDKEGDFMRRLVLLGSVCLAVVSLGGCHLCHKKHHAAAYYEDPCACATTVSGPATAPVPLSYETVTPAPPGNVIPTPPKAAVPPQG
jgi:hypothetical protein